MNVTKATIMMAPRGNRSKKFVAWAKIVIDDVLLITGIKLFESKMGNEVERYIRFPDKRIPLHLSEGENMSVAICNTMDEEFRKHITDTVFAAWDQHPRNPKNSWKKKQEFTRTKDYQDE